MNNQKWQCKNEYNIVKIEDTMSNKYGIKTVCLCDMDYDTAKKISDVFDKFFALFPNTYGKLTNVTVNNAINKDDYIAYFQPIYQFVNNNNDINEYNKVNKTQILLNSYYFLNKDVTIKDDLYVNEATKESLIAHELGHYLIFLAVLKENNVDNIVLVNKENEEKINNVLNNINNSNTSKAILDESISLYNNKYKENLNIEQLASNISNYAYNNAKINIYDEVIAEAIHDYYLHETNTNKYSSIIIEVLKNRLR